MCIRVVLSVVSKIFDKSELLSCLLEMGVEYYLVCIREGLLCGKGVEPPRGRRRLSGARESQLFVGVYYNKTVFKDVGSEHFVVCLSCAYVYVRVVMPSYLLFCRIYFNAWCITCCPKREAVSYTHLTLPTKA